MISELPPGYKQTEVGVIPQDWSLGTFSDLFDFTNGVNADKSAYGRGVPFINVLEVITHTHIRFSQISGRVTLTKAQIDSFSVRRGDIVFNRTSETQEEVGLCSVYLDDEVVVFGGFVIRARPRRHFLDAVYSGYALRTPVVRSQISAMGQGAIRANVGQADLRKVYAPLPPRSEQEAIAEALSDTDALIESLDQLIAKKRHLKQGAMQELLTGRRRLLGFVDGWKEALLGDVIEKFVGGGTPSRANASYWGSEIPWVTVKDFATFSPRHAQEAISMVGLNSSASHLIPKGTLITSTRMALGKAVVYEVDVAINQDLKALFPKPILSTQYLYFWFQYRGSFIDALGSGSTVKGISLPDLKNIDFRLPSFSEQTAIATILSDMDTEIAALEAKLTKTRQLKQGMMAELLTGRTRLV